MRRKASRKRNNQFRIKTKLVLVSIVLIFAFVYFEASFSATISKVAGYKAKVIATQIINKAIEEQLQGEVDYKALVNIRYDEQNNVTAIETNSMQINQIRNEISTEIIKEIEVLKKTDIGLPLSTLLGSTYFLNTGPQVPFKIYPTGFLNSKILSQFDDGGINQTRHRLVLQISVDVICILPFYREKSMIDADYILAETIVVGKIPSNYTKVVSEDQDLISKINDYPTPE